MSCSIVAVRNWTPPSSCAKAWLSHEDANQSPTIYRQMTFSYYASEDTSEDFWIPTATSDACLPPSSTGCAFSYATSACIAGYTAIDTSTLVLPGRNWVQTIRYCCPTEAPSTASVPTRTGGQGTNICVTYAYGSESASTEGISMYTRTSPATTTTTWTDVTTSTAPVTIVYESNDRLVTTRYTQGAVAYMAPMLVMYDDGGTSSDNSYFSTATSDASSMTRNSGPSLGVGAIVGIAIAGLACLVAGIVLFLFLRRRKSRHKAVEAQSGTSSDTDWRKAELDGDTANVGSSQQAELHGTHSAELHSDSKHGPPTYAKEMEAVQEPAELASAEQAIELPTKRD